MIVQPGDQPARLQRGDVIDLEVTAVAHGGLCVGRFSGQVVFVRHTIPGERVRARVGDAPSHGRFVRADTEAVLRSSPDRVSPPCPYAGVCGGCDWQHVSLAAQRQLKASVVREQLARVGQEDPTRWLDLVVEPVPGDDEGLGWRTRMRYAVDARGRAGLRGYRANDVVPIDTCLIAAPGVRDLQITRRDWVGRKEVTAVAPSASTAVAIPDARPGVAKVREVAADRVWRMDATAFWQVHPGAADTLVGAVREVLNPRGGDHLLDLYSGVGLFAGALADDVGEMGQVDAVESDAVAVRSARRNLHDLPQVRIHGESVDRWLGRGGVQHCDLIVLDPPRSGAGKRVMASILQLRPRAIAYVACDPASLARDIATAKRVGWRLSSLRAFDVFPMTHHVECVALLEPQAPAGHLT